MKEARTILLQRKDIVPTEAAARLWELAGCRRLQLGPRGES